MGSVCAHRGLEQAQSEEHCAADALTHSHKYTCLGCEPTENTHVRLHCDVGDGWSQTGLSVSGLGENKIKVFFLTEREGELVFG